MGEQTAGWGLESMWLGRQAGRLEQCGCYDGNGGGSDVEVGDVGEERGREGVKGNKGEKEKKSA